MGDVRVEVLQKEHLVRTNEQRAKPLALAGARLKYRLSGTVVGAHEGHLSQSMADALCRASEGGV